MDHLLAPRRGQVTSITSPSPLGAPIQPASPHEDQLAPVINDDIGADLPDQPLLDHQPVPQLPQPQWVQPSLTAHQTCSDRVIQNTPRNDQSISQRNQGLGAWEVLLDQDEQEDIPTAASQYAIQKALENPIAFAASNNPDILYWDQAMKTHDHDKFIKAVESSLTTMKGWVTMNPY